MQSSKASKPKLSLPKTPILGSFGYVAFISLLLICVLGYFVQLAFSERLPFLMENEHFSLADFVTYYQCGKTILFGLGHKILDSATQVNVLNRIITPYHTDKAVPIGCVPLIYLIMIPFATLPIHISHLVWSLGSLALACCTLAFFLRQYRGFSRKWTMLFLVGMAASIPSLAVVYFGQMSFWLVTLICLYCYAFLTKRDIVAGITLALTSIKPQFSLLFFLPALAERRWKLLTAAILSEAAFIALTAQAVTWKNVLHYPYYALNLETLAGSSALFMVGFRGLLARILPAEIVMPVALWLMLICCVMIFFFWQPSWAKNRYNASWGLALVVILDLLASPHSFIYDCTLISVAAALTLPTLRVADIDRITPFSLRLWTALLLFYPLISYILFFFGGISGQLPASGFAILNLALFVAGSRYIISGAHAPEEGPDAEPETELEEASNAEISQ
jgi:hypothetical protein